MSTFYTWQKLWLAPNLSSNSGLVFSSALTFRKKKMLVCILWFWSTKILKSLLVINIYKSSANQGREALYNSIESLMKVCLSKLRIVKTQFKHLTGTQMLCKAVRNSILLSIVIFLEIKNEGSQTLAFSHLEACSSE